MAGENATPMTITINDPGESKGKVTFTLTGEFDPRASQSGKSVLLATSAGSLPSGTKFRGYPVSLNVNITIPHPDATPKPQKTGPNRVKVGG